VAVAVGSIAGALLVGVVLVVTLKPPPAPPPPPPPSPKTVVEQHEPPPKKMVRSVLASQPPGAMVVRQRDGQVLGITPLTMTNPAGDGSEPVRVVLQGYAEETVALDLTKDSEQKLDLRKLSRRESKRNKNLPTKGYVPGDLTVVD
jgi:hypothetical protein